MARTLLFPALILAFLALRGWPQGWDVWSRALIALASLSAAFAAMTWLTPPSGVARFRNVRKPGTLDHIARTTAVALTLIVVYFLFVFGPAATRQLSYLLASPGEFRLDASKDEEEDWDYSDAEQGGARGGNAVHTRVGTVFDPEGAPVPSLANLASSDKPEVRLELNTAEDARRLHHSGAIYLTAFSHDTFDGHRWTSQGSAGPRILTGDDRHGRIHLGGSESASPPAYHYHILHGRLDDGLNTVKALQGTHYVQLPAVTQITPGTYVLPALDRSVAYYEYEAGSSPRRYEALTARSLPIEPGTTGAVYRAPASHAGLHRQIQDLSARFSPDLPLEQRLSQLLTWLRGTYSYSLLVNYPNNGKCALENFLGNPDSPTHAGFCVHFASAAALLAREIGVPSRMCYGWTGGQFYEQHRQLVFRGNHAHTWTEIFLKDHGWVVFDATPPSSLPQPAATAPGEAPPALEEFLGEDLEESAEASRSSFPVNWKWALAVCGAGLAALVILLLLKRGGGSTRSAQQPFSARSAPAPGYLRLFHEGCMRHGHPIPTGRTLLQQLESLKDRDVPVHFADDLLTYHYGITYRNLPRNAQTEKSLCKQIRSWPPGS